MTTVWWQNWDQQTAKQVGLILTRGEGPGAVDQDAEPNEQMVESGKRAIEAALEEIESLNGTHVLLRSLTPGISGARVFRATPKRGPHPELDCVLKIGPAGLLANEADKYANVVRGHIKDSGAKVAYRGDIAQIPADALVAIQYEDAGNTTFGEYLVDLIERNEVDDACDAIDGLLSVLRPWQEMMRVDTSSALTKGYTFKDLVPGADPQQASTFGSLESVCKGMGLGDLSWLDQLREFWKPGLLAECRTLTTAVHGDLHTDNVMVRSDGNLKMIDFGAVQQDGHFLRDICTMEAHLLMRAMVKLPQLDIPRYLEELDELYEPAYLLDPFSSSANTPVKAVVSRLRRYAFASLMNGDTTYSPQYAFAVLRHAMRIAIRTEQEGTSERERKAAIRVTWRLTEALRVKSGQLEVALPQRMSRRPANRRLTFLDASEGRWGDGMRAPVAPLCEAETWQALADELLASRRIEFFGAVPLPLLDVLLKRTERLTKAEGRVRNLHVSYVASAQVGVGDGELSFVHAHPRWQRSLMGMRNLVGMLIDRGFMSGDVSRPFTTSTSLANNCLIRVEDTEQTKRSIYVIARISEATNGHPARFTLNRIDAGGPFVDWITDTHGAVRKELVLRECVCRVALDIPTGSPVDGPFIAPVVSAVENLGARTVAGLRQVVIVMLRCGWPSDPRLVMKVRSEFTDADDFGKLSFHSAAVLTEDIARAELGSGATQYTPQPNARDDYRQLWNLTGQRDDWALDERSLQFAAQRAVHAATTLAVDPARFEFRGQLFTESDAGGFQTCFTAFTADLRLDEVHTAEAASRDVSEGVFDPLQVVPVSDAFTEEFLSRADSFTVLHRNWLSSLASTTTTPPLGTETSAPVLPSAPKPTWVGLLRTITGEIRMLDHENPGCRYPSAATDRVRVSPDATVIGAVRAAQLHISWLRQSGSRQPAPALDLATILESPDQAELLAIAIKDSTSVLCLLSDSSSTFLIRVRPFETIRQQRYQRMPPLIASRATAGVLWADRALLVTTSPTGHRVNALFPELTDIQALEAAYSGRSLLVAAFGCEANGAPAVHLNGRRALTVPDDVAAVGLVHETDPSRPPSLIAEFRGDAMSYRELRLRYDWTTEGGGWL